MDEADKKIDVLFEAFCTQKVPSPVVSELEALCNGMMSLISVADTFSS